MLSLIAAVICTLGCTENRPDGASVVVGDSNTTEASSASGGNYVVVDANTSASNAERVTIETDGPDTIFTGRIVQAVISRDTRLSSVFTFSEGSVISVRNAQEFRWKTGKTHRIRGFATTGGYQVDEVTIMD